MRIACECVKILNKQKRLGNRGVSYLAIDLLADQSPEIRSLTGFALFG
jgi:hypothetical protein